MKVSTFSKYVTCLFALLTWQASASIFLQYMINFLETPNMTNQVSLLAW